MNQKYKIIRQSFFSVILLSVMLIFNSCGIILPPSSGGILNPPVSNPFPELASVQLVGCYGNRGAATAEFVFTVTSHTNIITSGTFGFPNAKFVARGTTYKPYSSSGTKVELVRGYPSEVVMSIRSVPDYLLQFDRIELAWYFDAAHHNGTAGKNLMFHNVPIIWK